MNHRILEPGKPSSFPSSGNSFDPLPLPDPPELKSQIFVYACHERLQKEGQWRRQFSPLHLGWVCRSWREFAWSTPELWSTIVVRLGKMECYEVDTFHLTLLREWFSRANKHELEIYLEKIDRVDSSRPPFATLNLLKEYCTQWRAIYLRVPAWWCGLLGGPWTKLSFPNLKYLLVDGDHSQGSPFGLWFCPLDLTSAPLLTDLTLGDFALLDSSQAFKLPLAQITRIDTVPYTKIDLKHHLSLFPNLTEIRFANADPVGMVRQTSVLHPKIQSLHLHFQYASDMTRFLAAFSAPAVKTLGVDVFGMSRDFMMDIISPFILRSQCRLTRLYLRFTAYEQDLIAFLATLPELNELHIHDPFQGSEGLTHRFFDVLSPFHISGHPYLPLLRTLSYEGPLWVKPQDFLRPLILRAILYKDGIDHSDKVAAMAVLKSVRITADLYEDEEGLQNPNAPFTNILLSLQDLLGSRVFELVNRDGTWWRL